MPNFFYSKHLLKSMDCGDKFSLPLYNSVRPNDMHRRDLKKSNIYQDHKTAVGAHMEPARYEQSGYKQFVEKKYDTGMG